MSFTVGVVGATGAVGKEIVGCLNKSSLDVSQLRIFGSERSAGSTRECGAFGTVQVELFDVAKARECDVVFLAVSGDFALEHARAISQGDGGAVVIDNSSAFRYEKDVPLVVPEINVAACQSSKLIANPNCTTAIGLMALWPLHKAFKLKKVIMSVRTSHDHDVGRHFEAVGESVVDLTLTYSLRHSNTYDSFHRPTKPPLELDKKAWTNSVRELGPY